MGDGPTEASFVRSVTEALGGESKNFNIEFDGFLVEEEHYISAVVGVQPKEVEIEDYRVSGDRHLLQVDYMDGDFHYIIGEDTEIAMTRSNTYSQLYWMGVTIE